MASVSKSGSEFLVNTTTAGEQQFPSVAALSNGGFVVTWEDTSQTDGDTSYAAVRGQIFDASGAKVGPEFLVNTTTAGDQFGTSVAALSTGGFVVTWGDGSGTDGDMSGFAVRGQIFDASGAKVGSEFLVNTTTTENQDYPNVAALSTGGFVVTWEDTSQSDGDTSGLAVRGQVFDASGNKVGSEFLVNTTTAGDQYSASVAVLSNGGFVVTWTDGSQSDGDTSGTAVRGQVFDASGNKVGAEFLVNTTTAGYQTSPSVAALSTGGFVVTWTDYSQTDGDTSDTAVRGQVFDAGGTKVGAEFLVNTTTTENQDYPNVAALSTGGFVVTWEDTSQSDGDTSGSAVRGQVFDAGGTKVGAEFLVNTTTAGVQEHSSVAGLSTGSFVVTWDDFSQTDGDTSSDAVRGQIFNASANTAPTAVDDRWLVSRSTKVTASASVLTANDSDPDGDTLTVTAVSNPVNATVALQNGQITFTTSADSSSFQYTVSDGQGGTANATVQVSSVATGNGADTVDASNYTFAFLEGGNGDDRLTGSPGDDVLSGGNGDDVLTGGGGRDTLTGGNGADTFRYTSPQEGGDTITDFTVSTDRLQIYSPNFGNLTPAAGGTLAAENFTANANGTATRASDRFVFNTTTGLLSYDSDGTGPTQAVAVATLRNGSDIVTTLSERDIVLFATTS